VATDPGGSLADGVYKLTVAAASITGAAGAFDGNADGAGGDDYSSPTTGPGRIFRLFGDADGDGTVGATDFSAFRLAYGGPDPTFDGDGNGDVDALDFGAFRRRFGMSV